MRTLTQPLNMSPGGIPPVIHISQYDSDFTIVFTLFSTVGDFTIESGTTAMVRGTKSSGTGYSADATINISAKTVTVTGNQQMTAAAGQNVFEITLYKNNKEISSKNFILLCERAALDADTITDESVLKELNAIIESADTATQAAEEAEDAADRAEAAAQTLVIDSTLTRRGQPADAKATGDKITALTEAIAAISSGLSDTAKQALLACFRHVAWIDEHGQDYYDALESALYADQYPKITATFNSGTNTIYTDDDISSLKQYLTVKYYADRSSAGQIISANDYTLTGTLTEGTSTMFVAYNNLTTVFTINGVVDFYNIWNWSTEYDDVGALEKVRSFVDATRDSQRRGFYTNSTQNSRFGIAVSKGKQAAIEYSTSVATDQYPVPIPKTATKVTVSVTPATDYLFCYIGRYEQGIDASGYDYVMVNEAASWTHQGTYTCEFTAGENLFIGYNGKKSDNSAYTDADRAARVVTVTFE